MKTLLTIALTLACSLSLLSLDFSPWMVLKRTEYKDLQDQIERLSKPAPAKTGAWMHESDYRTALEKTTVVGVPESSRSREHGLSR